MRIRHLVVLLAVSTMILASCSAPKYLALPETVSCPVVQNTCSFGIQNMDQQAKVENTNLTCHYENFDIQYTISDDFIISFTIINNSNKDLLIDKSQCFVLYDGNSTQLFKDARMSGSTTFNDVTGAINVSTSHGSVMMTIPSYSKWSPTINETNLRYAKVPDFMTEEGLHHLSVYDNPETVEFIIPYSYDGTMKNWSTCRNKVFVNTVFVENKSVLLRKEYSYTFYDYTKYLYKYNYPSDKKLISPNEYIIRERSGSPDFSEVKRINNINDQLFKKHNLNVRIGRIVGGVITLPTIVGPFLFWASAINGCGDKNHKPPRGALY